MTTVGTVPAAQTVKSTSAKLAPPHFFALLTPSSPADELEHLGGSTIWTDHACALGWLDTTGAACPVFQTLASDGTPLRAVGRVSLYNRPYLLSILEKLGAPGLPDIDDGTLLLQLYGHLGAEGLSQASGSFVLAVWDGRQLIALRDPIGSRTVFYAQRGRHWAVTSSLQALRRWRDFVPRLNLPAVRSFLTFAYLPGDETLVEHVWELTPGSIARFDADGHTQVRRYWEPREQLDEPMLPVESYAQALCKELEQAVAERLPAGEEVGVFLSGGLDSSLITALAAKLHGRRVRSYAISFGDELPNELAYSGLVATHCGTSHQVLSFSGKQIARYLTETVAHLDCPVGDPLTVPNLLLARAAAKDGLSVILNGEGGDPCFGGPKNISMLMYELYRHNFAPEDRARAYLRSYRKCYTDLGSLLTPAALEALRSAPPLERLVQPHLEHPGFHSYLNRLLYTNIVTKGAHHILPKVERLTTACNIEGRSPLFDHRVVAASLAIPPQLKLAGTREKWVLKCIAEQFLPPTVVHRPKSGMRVPVQHWLRGPLRELANDLLLSRRARERGLIRQDLIRTWLRGEGDLWQRQGSKLWLVLTLELWLRTFID